MLPQSPPRLRFWMDTEFIEDGKSVDLLSIGICSEDNREYYAVSSECDVKRANPWVQKNVLPKIDWGLARPRKQIRHEINRFIADVTPEFWAYYADYDWVCFCFLFGKMVDLPQGWPMCCNDIKQYCTDLGNPTLPPQSNNSHCAIDDARWNRKAWEFLREIESKGENSARALSYLLHKQNYPEGSELALALTEFDSSLRPCRR